MDKISKLSPHARSCLDYAVDSERNSDYHALFGIKRQYFYIEVYNILKREGHDPEKCKKDADAIVNYYRR